MMYKQFFPGDTVITIVESGGVPSGTVGRVASRWAGTGYSIRLSDGSFRWLNDRDFASTDPTRHRMEVGDIGVVTSDKYQDFAEVGEIFQIYKVAYDVDYYGVLINDDLKWFGGFQLALYRPV